MAKVIKTMEDFSAFVGLSRPTVSKYFNDPNSVRTNTRNVIEAAIKKSGFRPSILAVNLNRRRSNIIGAVIPDSSDPFYMALTRRIELMALAAGYLTFVLSSDGRAEMEDEAIKTLKSLNIAGAVIAPLGIDSHRGVLSDLGASIPLVYVDSPLDEHSSFVGTDNSRSFQLMVDYLCRSGEPPCYFPMPPVNSNSLERERAYVSAMRQFKLEPRIVPVLNIKTWDFERFGFEQANRVLSQGGFPTKTVLCANDRIAFGVISAAYQAGLKVGHRADCDLRVAGHDDHPLSRYACPPITTVAQNYSEIGKLAIELLLRKIDSAEPSSTENPVLLTAELMLRDSA
jgi:DNA-binding LacI/PurR family transcriptional regulator